MLNAVGNLKIGTRLTAAFATIIALLIAVAAIGYTKINAVNGNTEIILHDRYAKVALAQTVENEVNKQLRAMRTALIASDAAVVKRELRARIRAG